MSEGLFAAIQDEVAAGRVDRTEHGNLVLFKYSRDCSQDRLWNPVNRHCRGIIFTKEGRIVARPFSKFFNVAEMPETMPEALPWSDGFDVQEKVDGSCGIAYRNDGGWALATPGAFESDQAKVGTRLLHDLYDVSALPRDATTLFEIVYPENQIVVQYDRRFLSLLGVVRFDGSEWTKSEADELARRIGCERPAIYPSDVAREQQFQPNQEGYVIQFRGGLRVKLKSPWYVGLHKMRDLMTVNGVIDLVMVPDFKRTDIPKELGDRFDDIYAAVMLTFATIRDSAVAAEAAIPPEAEDRKSKALWIQAKLPKHLWPLVFQLLDGRDITSSVWKTVRMQMAAPGDQS